MKKLTLLIIFAQIMQATALSQDTAGMVNTHFSELLLDSSTEKFIYYPDETIEIEISALNIGTEPYLLCFSTSCHTLYYLDNTPYISGMLAWQVYCMTLYYEISLEPGETISWSHSHSLDDLSLGYHDLIGVIDAIDNPLYTDYTYFQILEGCSMPQVWYFIPTFQAHTIEIPPYIIPDFFGDAVNEGDWLGVFYYNDQAQLVCGGAGRWSYLGGAIVTAFGDNPSTSEKDGFAPGEEFHWKIFSCSEEDAIMAVAEYDPQMPHQGTFVSSGYSSLTYLAAVHCISYSFNTGWNSLSTHVIPHEIQTESLFNPLDELIILSNPDGFYWPEGGINTLENWDETKGYVIKVDSPTTFNLCGETYTSNSIAFDSGWHYIPVLNNCSYNSMDLFENNIDDIEIVQELIGTKVFWPTFNVFTLDTLEQKKAYLIKVINPFTLDFPGCD